MDKTNEVTFTVPELNNLTVVASFGEQFTKDGTYDITYDQDETEFSVEEIKEKTSAFIEDILKEAIERTSPDGD